LFRSNRPVPILNLMEKDRPRVSAVQDQEEVARLFQRYNWVTAPVVDTGDRLVGVITFDDVADVIEEEAEEDIHALGGITRDEQLSDSVWKIARGRFNWLLVNLATAFLASSVLGLFEGQLQKMVALAVLAPIVASQGGNATTQTMTVAVRALATRDLSDSNAWRVIKRELMVGVFNGVAFAIITGVAAYIWFSAGARVRDRTCHDLQPDRGGPRRNPYSARPAPAQVRSGGGFESLCDNGHRRGGLFLVSEHCEPVVWPAVGRGPPVTNCSPYLLTNA
jgi:Mg/Co/Ni transporter MgtE